MKSRSAIIILGVLIMASAVFGQKLKLKTAPDFTLKDIKGKRVTLSKNFGEGPIYISFWATWCKPCREELKIIQGLYEKYGERGFRVFAINIEGPKASGKIKSFVKSNGWTFDILLDTDGEVFRRKFKGFATPYTVMTDPQGKIILNSIGFKPGDEKHVEDLILQYLPASDNEGDKTEAEE